MKKRTTLTQAFTLHRKKLPALLTVLAVVVVASVFLYQQNTPIKTAQQANTKTGDAVAYFAGGCFWSTESALEKMGGVTDVVSGYMGGNEVNPSYEDVSSDQTRHRESVKVTYDSSKVSYAEITEYFLKHIDPTDPDGSFYDRGFHYTSAIYYQTDKEKAAALRVIAKLDGTKRLEKPIVTKVELAKVFYPAEEYHQDYSKKNAVHYGLYRKASGRDEFFAKTWK